MFLSRFILTIVCLITFLFAHSQFTDKFKSIDEKDSFKDIVFGSKLIDISRKMGLIKKEGTNQSNRYNITQRKYLTIGIYGIKNAFTEFTDNKLSMIVFEVPNPCKEVLEYFTKMFGKPTFEKAWLWEGKNLTYALGCDINTSHALIIITSNSVKLYNGEDNF